MHLINFYSPQLACELSQKKWAQKLLPLWVALAVMITAGIIWLTLAVMITAGIIWLTYYPGKGYVFLDNSGLIQH